MDFVQGLDPSKLVLFGTGFSFFLSGFSVPPYNLPIFLFGIYAQENTEGFLSLQAFTGLIGGSILYDVIWMIRNEQNAFIKLLTVVLLLVKFPTFFAFGLAARQRGAQFGGLGIRGNDISGPTVWAMPGGFTGGRDGYQNVDDEVPVHHPRATVPPPAPPAAAQTTPGAYQTV